MLKETITEQYVALTRYLQVLYEFSKLTNGLIAEKEDELRRIGEMVEFTNGLDVE